MNEEQDKIFKEAQESVSYGKFSGDSNMASAIVYAATVLANAINNVAKVVAASNNVPIVSNSEEKPQS
jgi:hypothetical protein